MQAELEQAEERIQAKQNEVEELLIQVYEYTCSLLRVYLVIGAVYMFTSTHIRLHKGTKSIKGIVYSKTMSVVFAKRPLTWSFHARTQWLLDMPKYTSIVEPVMYICIYVYIYLKYKCIAH